MPTSMLIVNEVVPEVRVSPPVPRQTGSSIMSPKTASVRDTSGSTLATAARTRPCRVLTELHYPFVDFAFTRFLLPVRSCSCRHRSPISAPCKMAILDAPLYPPHSLHSCYRCLLLVGSSSKTTVSFLSPISFLFLGFSSFWVAPFVPKAGTRAW